MSFFGKKDKDVMEATADTEVISQTEEMPGQTPNSTQKQADSSKEDADSLVIDLSREYDFEGRKIKTLDLSAIENYSIKDLEDLTTLAKKRKPDVGLFMPEASTTFAVCLAQKATGLPFEFFDLLSMSDGIALKNKVTNFLY